MYPTSVEPNESIVIQLRLFVRNRLSKIWKYVLFTDSRATTHLTILESGTSGSNFQVD